MNFLDSTFEIVCRDDYSSYYQQAKVDLKVKANGVVDWTVTMTNDHVGSMGRAIVLYVSVGGKILIDTGYLDYNNRGSTNWLTFPTGHNTSKSGSFTLSNTNVTYIDVEVRVCCMQSNELYGTQVVESLERNWYENGKTPTITIADQGNNTCLISGSVGKKGSDNNPLQSVTLYYTTDGSDPKSSSTRTSFSLTASSGESYTRSIDITKACTVKAYVECEFKHNTTSASGSAEAIYYVAPSKPGVPKLSYNKSRLTIKEPWTFTWAAATARNNDSPVRGYRIRIYKTGTLIKGLVDGTGNTISIDEGKQNEYLDLETTSCTITFDPVALGFSPGDKVLLGIYSYSKDGAGNQLWNDGGGADAIVTSDNYPVYNAGIVYVKVSGVWEEGQVWVKANNTWHEAETVNVKVNNTWQESQ